MNTKIIKSAAQACGFYDIPLYKKGDVKPDYYDLFDWKPWGGMLGFKILPPEDYEFASLFGGSLKEELFDTVDKKIIYLQGVFEDYSGDGLKDGGNYIHFANSDKKVERCKQWLNEVSKEFLFDNDKIYRQAIIRHNIEYLTPICHSLSIKKDIIEFIQAFRNEV